MSRWPQGNHVTPSPSRRMTPAGRWTPVFFYALVVLSWGAEAVHRGLVDRLWLVLFALPPLIAYLARMWSGRQ